MDSSGQKLEPWVLQQRQGLPLDIKIKMSQRRIKQWYDHWDGQVYVSFSGGKDSTVLLHLVRSLYPEVPAVFIDTGLEYPEVRDFVKTIENVTWLKPKLGFKDVLEKYGYPVVSKQQARYISDIQRASEKNSATVNLRLTGYNRRGVYCPSMKISKKWLYLTEAPFKISEKCCDALKKEPFKRYQKKTGAKPIAGIMAAESQKRRRDYLSTGCNSFDSKSNPISHPLSFWVESDIWEYIDVFSVQYSPIYDMGELRTGCMFCMFGVHLEASPNRFERMSKNHPAQWKYCINKLGCGRVLDFINVPYGAPLVEPSMEDGE